MARSLALLIKVITMVVIWLELRWPIFTIRLQSGVQALESKSWIFRLLTPCYSCHNNLLTGLIKRRPSSDETAMKREWREDVVRMKRERSEDESTLLKCSLLDCKWFSRGTIESTQSWLRQVDSKVEGSYGESFADCRPSSKHSLASENVREDEKIVRRNLQMC